MKLSNNSKKLMQFFIKNKYINHVKQTKQTDSIITEIYQSIIESHKYILNLNKTEKLYKVSIKKIVSSSQISKPKNFNSNSFPNIVRNHIDELTMTEITYIFSLNERNIKIHFIVEDNNIQHQMETYNKYVDAMIIWLHILNQHASKNCVNTLVVYLYFTSLEKKIPNSNDLTLDEINVNTAFTSTCPKDSEIVVFRKEEWFKVFIHETFHNFALDFSDMNNVHTNNCILNIFKVNSNVNLYESYTEFWAEIINASFCSFFSLKNKNDIDEFLSNFEILINFERTFSFFQLVKTLNFMGLTYKDLYLNTQNSHILRENLYKEKTNVLAYYVIKTILMNNYQGFLKWCKTNNTSLLQFKKTIINQRELCKFIENNYKTTTMLNGVIKTQSFLNNINNKNNKQNLSYILSNLRMSICELG